MQYLTFKLALTLSCMGYAVNSFAVTPIPTPIVANTSKKVTTPVSKDPAAAPIIQQGIIKAASTSKASTSQSSTKPPSTNGLINKPVASNLNGVDKKNSIGNSGRTASPTDGSDLITSAPTQN
jgi:hypothetical protein